jgi:methylenetetrahydrofolate reductase (NADPH)
MSALQHQEPYQTSASTAAGAVEKLLASADFEIIPLKGVLEKLAVVPAGTTITVTASSKLGLDRTLDYSASAAAAGYRVVPHLAARQVVDKDELRRFVGRLGEVGITDLYVIGGDATPPAGPYSSALEILEDLAGIDHAITSIGVACYPEGHALIPDASLLSALYHKASIADYMVSQLCFNADALVAWLQKVRAVGIELPLHIGLAAPLQLRKLAGLSLKLGIGSSAHYLSKQHGFLGHLLRGGAYEPEKFLTEIGDELMSTELRIEGVHVFSFNQLALTVDWQQRIIDPTNRRHEQPSREA